VKVTKDKVENHQAFLTIQIEHEEMEKEMDGAYRRLVQKANIPGFRKGKAPRVIFERYLGTETLHEDAIDHAIPEYYQLAIKEQEIEPVSQAQIEITQHDPLIYKAIVPLKPVVTLGDYHTIRVVPAPIEVTESNVNDVIEQLRHQHATWEPADREAAFDDLVVVDIESTAEGQTFINQKNLQYQIVKGQIYPVPGFSEQLIGMKKDVEKEFKLTLQADYPRKEIAGKESSFKVTIHEIKQEKLPEVNDDLAKAVDKDLLTVAAMREQATKELTMRAEERNKIDFEERVIDAVVDLSKIDYPQVLVDNEITRILSQRFQNNRESLENYLRMIGKTEEEVREELRPSAAKGVARSLALAQVAIDAKIEVTSADIDAEIATMTKDSTNKEEMGKFFSTPQVRESIEHTLLSRKTFQLLKDIAQTQKETKEQAKEEKKTRKSKKKDEEEKK
jgi:trigger factor